MYLRHRQAATWHDDPPSTRKGPQRPETGRPRIIWATTPWRGCRGRYVAIRLIDNELEVGIAGAGRLQWLSAEKCLTQGEAERWAQVGFG